jgi:anti-sigma B factor antagonist
MTDFQIAVAQQGGPCTLRVSGDVDLAVADDLRQAGLSCIESDDVGLRVDLEDVTFIDSTGLGALVQLRTAARDSGKLLQLVNVPGEVARMLQLTGLTDTFEVG